MLVAMLRSWRDKTELIVMMCKTHACSNEVIWSRCNSTISTFNIAQSFLFTFFKRFNLGTKLLPQSVIFNALYTKKWNVCFKIYPKKKKKSRLCCRKTFSLTQWLWISFDSSRISFNESLSLQFSAVVVKRLNYISDTILIKFAALKILCLMVYVKLGWLSYCQCGEVIQKIGTRGNNRSLKKRLSREKVP